MTPSTIYLVSGSNRGIGLGLVTQVLAKHDDAFVYAGARNPEQASALKELRGKYNDRIAIVKLVSADIESNTALAKEIEARHGRVDTVIANAGIGNAIASVADVSAAALEEHFHVNVIGTVVLFQAMYKLLRKSSTPRFVPISTQGSCLDGPIIRYPFGSVAYCSTKVALNWATRKIHFENEWLIAFPLSPGGVDTDMFQNNVATDTGSLFKKMVEANLPTVQAASVLLIKIIDESTREKEGGEFVHVDGTRLPW